MDRFAVINNVPRADQLRSSGGKSSASPFLMKNNN
jgi:hypothetical protein